MLSRSVERRAGVGASIGSMRLVHVACGLCGADNPEPVAVGEDFEYRTSDDTFLMVRCRGCGLLYLNPRPVGFEAERIASGADGDVPSESVSARIAARMRHRLEAGRLWRFCRGLPARARVLDIGCGDGSQLARMREFASSDACFEGVESDASAVARARTHGSTVHHGHLGQVKLDYSSYDVVLARRALERSGDPGALLQRVRAVLRPGGILIVEAGNAASPGSRVFRDRYWSGYRFPQAWNIFTAATVSRLATSSGLHVKSLATRVSPFGWIDSIRNALIDARAPNWLVGRFTHDAPALLALFTVIDALGAVVGDASVLCVTLQRPPL